MTKEELIAEQQIKIRNLERAVEKALECGLSLHLEIWGIGGPLNDNKLSYNKAQMTQFLRMSERVEEMNGALNEGLDFKY